MPHKVRRFSIVRKYGCGGLMILRSQPSNENVEIVGAGPVSHNAFPHYQRRSVDSRSVSWGEYSVQIIITFQMKMSSGNGELGPRSFAGRLSHRHVSEEKCFRSVLGHGGRLSTTNKKNEAPRILLSFFRQCSGEDSARVGKLPRRA
ncbi:hypothetical protein AVEN_183311-1 [Araneus ventricosus]|uniref:Uncharacterized protein n=1 Tax=Araneus ventricosus TaxID=182803 RepID=A0A4Y2U7E4_ARAVE|nr:hypothetical protein AVEN_183311-1 [Araneus ventricosus]